MNYLNLNCPPMPYYLAGGKITCDINVQLPRRQVKTFTFIYIEKGNLLLEQESMTAQLKTGDYFIATPHCTYLQLTPCTEKTMMYWISFRSSLSFSLSDTCTACSPQSMEGDRNTSSQLFVTSIARHRNVEKHNRIYLEELLQSLTSSPDDHKGQKGDGTTDPVQLFEQQISFLQLLSLLQSQQYSPDLKFSITERLHNYIDKHFIEDIRLGDLAKQYSYSPSHMTRCFNEAYGLSPKQYVKKLRVQKAARLLTYTDRPVQTIGDECGFNISSYFIKQFKKEYGMTPSQYRMNANTRDSNP